MTRTSTIGWLLVLAAVVAAGSPLGTTRAQRNPIAVIVHPSNSTDHLSAAELEAIFTSRRRHWSGGKNIVAFNYPAEDSLRRAFDRAVLRMDPDEVSKFWINQRIRGRQGAPRKVPRESLMVRVVERMEEAIGYAPVDLARRANVKVVAIVRGGKVRRP